MAHSCIGVSPTGTARREHLRRRPRSARSSRGRRSRSEDDSMVGTPASTTGRATPRRRAGCAPEVSIRLTVQDLPSRPGPHPRSARRRSPSRVATGRRDLTRWPSEAGASSRRCSRPGPSHRFQPSQVFPRTTRPANRPGSTSRPTCRRPLSRYGSVGAAVLTPVWACTESSTGGRHLLQPLLGLRRGPVGTATGDRQDYQQREQLPHGSSTRTQAPVAGAQRANR